MPPKKKGAEKKPRTTRLINGLTMEEMSSQQLEELSVSLREQLEREREETDCLRRERDNIHAAGKITDRRLEEAEAELQNLEKELEDDERRYQVEVKVYKQKMKHVLHEHQNTMSGLKAEGSVSTEVLQEEQEQLEAELQMGDLQRLNYEKIEELKMKLEEEMTEARNTLVKNVSEMKSTYKEKAKFQRQAFEDMVTDLTREREDQWRHHIISLKNDHDSAFAEAKEIIDLLKSDKRDSVKRQIDRLRGRHLVNHKHLVALTQDNKALTERLLNVREQIAEKERRIQYCEMKKDTSDKHHMKALNDLKLQHEDLEQKFSKLQLEREEQHRKHCQTRERVQREADLQISVREKKLKALMERLEETQARLHSVLSASNMDQTAFAGITKTIEENLDSCNKSIKNLQDKKAQISKAHKDLLLSSEAKQSVSGERP